MKTTTTTSRKQLRDEYNDHSVPAVVSVEWLKEQLDKIQTPDHKLRVLDVTWYSAKDGEAQYKQKHIKTAGYLNPFHQAKNTDIFPRNIPEEQVFQEAAQAVGINSDTHVIVYDQEGQNGFFVGGRAWWTFKVNGCEKVSVLNGGLQKWEAMGYPVTTDVPTFSKGNFQAKYNGKWRRSFEDAKDSLGVGQLVDSRGTDKYNAGHIKGAASLPFPTLFENGVLKEPDQLKKAFKEKGVDLSKPLITHCTSGMSSTTLAIAAHMAGASDVSVFHGGMTEWKAKADQSLVEKN